MLLSPMNPASNNIPCEGMCGVIMDKIEEKWGPGAKAPGKFFLIIALQRFGKCGKSLV